MRFGTVYTVAAVRTLVRCQCVSYSVDNVVVTLSARLPWSDAGHAGPHSRIALPRYPFFPSIFGSEPPTPDTF